ncbi:hypothetical protein [Variovorax sp. UMC13]|uniref:hypothetical protein n=1 Tax=Variovorax sp. UMC13 TaxID=1862326 RepID=UPI0015FF4DDF|nr:hypothetical protein [Variovorax sp. UMC13]
MKLAAVIPTPMEVGREVLIVVGGALVAALLISNWPWARKYIRDAWALPVTP